MKPTFRHSLCFSLIAAAAALAPFAQAATDLDAVVRKAVEGIVPNAKIDAIEPAPMAGYRQVVTNGSLLYVSDDGRYVLQGTLYDAKERRDVSGARLARVHAATLAAVPAAKHIVFAPAGKPKYKVTVFTDIDCGYCRKLHSHIAEYNERGIEVDYLFFPRTGPGTPSFAKAVSVWCAADRRLALTAAKAGQEPQASTCDNPIAEQFQLGMKVGVDGTPTVFAPDGSKIGGYLTPDQMQAALEATPATPGS